MGSEAIVLLRHDGKRGPGLRVATRVCGRVAVIRSTLYILAVSRVTRVEVVSQSRDGWDILLYVVALLAAIAALISFGAWLVEQRKRPEAMIRWFDSSRAPWGPERMVALRLGQEVELTVAFDNVGRASGPVTMVNLCVPDFVKIERKRLDGSRQSALESGNAIAGVPERDHKVNFLADERSFPPGTCWLYRFMVTVTEDPGVAGPFNVLAELSNDRFTASGRQFLPSYFGRKLPAWQPGLMWPGDEADSAGRFRFWERWRRTSALPTKRLRCEAGGRLDIRQFTVRM
jgi:hypothetical protein